MRIAPLPFNEELRLQDLFSYDILDSEAEKEFDDLLEVVAQICGCPMAAVTFIDQERQWLKAQKGIPFHETPRDVAFCAHTILEEDLMVVPDAKEDERFFDNPLVKDGLRIRFYAGAPIVSEGGYKLGSVCVIDSKPRKLTEEEAKVLKIISRQISKLLELRMKNRLLQEKAKEQLELDKNLVQKTLKDQEDDRFAIGSELHENIAQGLAATKFYLEMAEETGSAKEELIRKSKENITKLIHDVRNLSRSITPSTMKDFDVKDMITGLLSQFQAVHGIETTFFYEETRKPGPGLALTLYRIVEDQLENILKHAGASSVRVNLQVLGAIHLSIADNGAGLELSTFKKGAGVHKILARLEPFRGNLDISGSPNVGCELTITIPLPSPTEKQPRQETTC